MLTEFVAEQAGGLLQVVNQLGMFRLRFSGVMIDNDPIHLVQTRLETEIANPTGFLAEIAHAPAIVVVSLEWNVDAEQMFAQPLQKQTGNKTV